MQREREDKGEKTTTSDTHFDERKSNQKRKKRKSKLDATTYVENLWARGQYLLVTWTYEKPTAFP